MGKPHTTKSFAPNYRAVNIDKIDVSRLDEELPSSLETAYEEATRRIKARFAQSILAQQGFPKPRFGSPAYQQYLQKGYISKEEAEADALMQQIRAERARKAMPINARALTSNRAIASAQSAITARTNIPLRWAKEAPIPSDQYAPNMATSAARDDRLTPNAKALLQIIHARCARAGETETTKATLANIMNRSVRSIQRYLADLVQFGYLNARIKRNHRGLYIGLILSVTKRTKPFYASLKRTAKLIGQTIEHSTLKSVINPENPDRTNMSPKKQLINILEKKWGSSPAFRQ